MTTIGELLGAFFGPLAELVAWIFNWIPQYAIVQWNERGVKYPAGAQPVELLPGRRSCPRWARWILLRNVLPGGRRLHLPLYKRVARRIASVRGVHWYCPNLTEIEKHHISRCVLAVEPLSLETSDQIPVQVGMVLTYHIVDVLAYEVENYDADDSMAEAAQGAMQDIITGSTWEELRGNTGEGTRLGNKLASRMNKALSKFGVEVESCRPTDQARLSRVFRFFGLHQELDIG